MDMSLQVSSLMGEKQESILKYFNTAMQSFYFRKQFALSLGSNYKDIERAGEEYEISRINF